MTSPPAPLQVKPEFIVDLALGIYPPDKLCAKHGVSDLELMQLYTQEWFNRAIAEKKAELEKAGFNFTAKMKMMAEDMLIDAYHAAKLSDAVTPKLDVAKQLVKVAGLEPTPAANGNLNAPGFTINISLPKAYIDALHDKSVPQEMTLTRGEYSHIEDVIAELEGTPPALDITPINNKDLT